MTTALVKGKPEIKDTGKLQEMAQAITASEMCPPQFRGKPADAFVAIITGAEIGFQPMQALKSIAVVNGRPSIYGDGLPAIAYGSGVLKRFGERFEGKGDDLEAVVEIERSDVEGVREFRFSVADAKKASLWGKKGPWSSYPRRMLQMRARAYAFRDTFADHLAGLHVAEEAQDIPVEPSMPEENPVLAALDVVPVAPEEPEGEIVDAEIEPVDAQPVVPEDEPAPLAVGKPEMEPIEPLVDSVAYGAVSTDEPASVADKIRQILSMCDNSEDARMLKADVQAGMKSKEISGTEAQKLLTECEMRAKELEK